MHPLRWLVAAAGALAAILCWTGVVGADAAPAARAGLGVAALSVGLWGSELVPLPATALLAMALLHVSGATTRLEEALSGMASPVLLFLLGTAAIGIAADQTGLADRMARWLLARSRGSPSRLVVELLVSLPAQAFFVPSAISRNAVLVPVYDRVLDRLGRPRRLGAAVMLTLGVLGPLASSALLTGGTSSVAAAHAIGGFTWISWLVTLALPYYVFLAVSGALVWLFCRPDREDHAAPADTARPDLVAVGGKESEPPAHRPERIGAAEWRVAAVTLGTSALWVADRWTHWPPTVPALLALVVLLLPRVGAMRWSAFSTQAPWGTCIVLAGATSLAEALGRTGAAAWMARGLFAWAPASTDPAVMALAVFAVTAVITLAIPNRAASITLCVPLAAAYAATGRLAPAAAGLIVMIVVDAETIYPAQTAANLMAYEHGYFSAGLLARFNLLTLIAAALVIVFVALPWWALVGLPAAGP